MLRIPWLEPSDADVQSRPQPVGAAFAIGRVVFALAGSTALAVLVALVEGIQAASQSSGAHAPGVGALVLADLGVLAVDHPVLDRVDRDAPRLARRRDAEDDAPVLLVVVGDEQDVAARARAAGVAPLAAARDTGLGRFAGWADPERIVGNLHRACAELAGTPRGGSIDVPAALADMVAYNGGAPLTCLA